MGDVTFIQQAQVRFPLFACVGPPYIASIRTSVDGTFIFRQNSLLSPTDIAEIDYEGMLN